MQLFLDTANLEEIKQGVRMGITGVTTNPSLVSKEGKVDYKHLVQQICDIVPGPVSTEVLSLDAAGMVEEARRIATWADNVVVKIPASQAGIEATRRSVTGRRSRIASGSSWRRRSSVGPGSFRCGS